MYAISTDPIEETGDLAIVAIIDEGIDIFHEAFLDTNGNTRIIAIWDQTDNTGPHPIVPEISHSFGREYRKEDINQYIQNPLLLPPNLEHSYRSRQKQHGTSVASIAAGSAIHNFSGVASESKIIIIIPDTRPSSSSVLRPGWENAYNQAFLYIRNLARQHNRPVVINISQGVSLGSRDGTSLMEYSCDLFLEHGQSSGLAIVTSAGNERDKQRHAEIPISQLGVSNLCWQSQGIEHQKDRIELWFKRCNTIRFRVINPSQEASEWVSLGDPLRRCIFQTGNFCQISCEQDRNNIDIKLLITIQSSDSSSYIEQGTWKLEIHTIVVNDPTDRIYAWIQDADVPPPIQRVRFTNYCSERTTLTIPATATNVIAVGSVNAASNTSSTFSSCGPTRDLRNQPLLVAPGENITTALATISVSSDSEDLVHGCRDRLVHGRKGTSMAAPCVTGAIALLFSARERQRQNSPEISQFTTSEIQQLIRETATSSDGTWNYDMGYGVLNVPTLLNRVHQ
jgi:endonuclease G